uniref:Uncharacterized protein n=1 Tax=Glossina austeni TaxID=7395 RepID=A0A1A9UDE6_GLOAU
MSPILYNLVYSDIHQLQLLIILLLIRILPYCCVIGSRTSQKITTPLYNKSFKHLLGNVYKMDGFSRDQVARQQCYCSFQVGSSLILTLVAESAVNELLPTTSKGRALNRQSFNNDDASEIKAPWRLQFEKSLNKIVKDRVALVLITRLGCSSVEFGR